MVTETRWSSGAPRIPTRAPCFSSPGAQVLQRWDNPAGLPAPGRYVAMVVENAGTTQSVYAAWDGVADAAGNGSDRMVQRHHARQAHGLPFERWVHDEIASTATGKPAPDFVSMSADGTLTATNGGTLLDQTSDLAGKVHPANAIGAVGLVQSGPAQLCVYAGQIPGHEAQFSYLPASVLGPTWPAVSRTSGPGGEFSESQPPRRGVRRVRRGPPRVPRGSRTRCAAPRPAQDLLQTALIKLYVAWPRIHQTRARRRTSGRSWCAPTSTSTGGPRGSASLRDSDSHPEPASRRVWRTRTARPCGRPCKGSHPCSGAPSCSGTGSALGDRDRGRARHLRGHRQEPHVPRSHRAREGAARGRSVGSLAA